MRDTTWLWSLFLRPLMAILILALIVRPIARFIIKRVSPKWRSRLLRRIS